MLDKKESLEDEKESYIIPLIKYSSHIEETGWTDYKIDGETSGTTGKAKRLEAYKIELIGSKDIEYRSYIEGTGWESFKKNGEISGTTGQSLPIEAIQIRINTKYYNDENQSNFEAMDTTKYTGYKEALQILQEKHPNWTMKLVYTGLDWNSVLTAEEGYSYGEPYSLTQSRRRMEKLF